MEAKDKIIVALDTSVWAEAEQWANVLADEVGMFKIGLQLFIRYGPDIVKRIKAYGPVFLDLKLNDIPNTVAGASSSIFVLGVEMFNVHASAGIEAIKAAVANKGNSKVLGVSVLTSIGYDECVRIFGVSAELSVSKLALMLKEAGADGIISSPLELALLSAQKELNGLIKVVPGVRPAWAQKNDQQRTMTPEQAIEEGADYLVIGRPITQPPKEISGPVEAARKIANEIKTCLFIREERAKESLNNLDNWTVNRITT